MDTKPLVGISSCLLGENVRYDGGNKLNTRLRDEMGRTVDFLPLCAEAESGMTIPREPMDLFYESGAVCLITLETGLDMTGSITGWIESKLIDLAVLSICGFIFKAKSPSCALFSARVYRKSGMYPHGRGLFAGAFTERFPLIPVVEDVELLDGTQRSDFLEKVFAMKLLYKSSRI
ncbi:MAG: DUF523 domain-containing protein [Candidatus Sabulitectum sp.]|nr:DUF523 domain-containing protein [Candidatus Sabulitectum sp.]